MKRLFLANANANANAASASASGGSGSGGGSAVVSGGDEHPPKRIAATLNSSSASPVAVAVPYQHSHAHSQPQTQYPRPDALADPNPVTAYQKNAIYRRMLEYKRLHADAADAVLALEDKQAGFAVCMSAFVSCLAQVRPSCTGDLFLLLYAVTHVDGFMS
ncbi:hypothetical protein BC830DRAFT_1122274 [Chytriomyces sp. MP71]|nr:hypothetical protein BC830DRAFT_1122274 [Chytriomyces sp. MP71]